MLSTENDSPCPQLKNASDDDDRPSHKLPLPLTEVDLPLPYPAFVSDDAHLSKFSIRDYVFTARSKDIKTNWPFSLRSLRLCLEHGVKELLPPFQSSDTLRNLSVEPCANKITTSTEERTSNIDAKPSNSKIHSELDPPDNSGPVSQKAEDCSTETVSSWSEGEKEFPSSAISVSQSEIESVQINSQSSPPLEANTSLGVEAEGSAPVRKSESKARPPGKKCKLIVKFGANAERNSVEDIASNCSSVSEMMASKVCPVCKTFTSSSNTTLNAHIDQCLTVEPTPNWTSGAKLTRHKIKPRKTKLMVDIYATAKPCTLEELDRRNGRNGATVPSLPTEIDDRPDISELNKMQRLLPHKPEDKGDVGAVYIDASGTKVRILSKSSDVPSVPKVSEKQSPLPRKPAREFQSSKAISKRKKRHHALRHLKYLHLTSQSKASCHKVHPYPNQVRPSYSGALQPWVCSKRTVAAKKVNNKVHGQRFKVNQFTSQQMVVNNARLAGRNQNAEDPTSGKTSIPRNDQIKERMGNVQCATIESASSKQTLQQMNGNCPAIRSRINENVERILQKMKENASLLSKVSYGGHLPSSIGFGDSSSSDKFTAVDESSVDDSNHGSGSNTQLSGSSGEVAVNATSLKRKFSSVGGRSTKPAYKANMNRKSVSQRTLLEHASLELDEELAVHSEIDQPCMKSTIENGEVDSHRKRLFGVGTALERKQASGGMSFPDSMEGIFTPQSRLNEEGGNGDACFELSDSHDRSGGFDSGKETIDTHEDDIDVQRSSRVSLRYNPRTLNGSVDPEFQRFGDKNLNHPCRKDQPFSKADGLISPADSKFINERERMCAFEDDDEMVRERNCMVDEVGSELAEENGYPKVDPIPIPGPPGSFLPSPGGTNLEEFQGNSLTTTDILSSPGQHGFIDGDSSDSPLSATITKSNSPESVSDKCSEPFSLGLHNGEDVTRTVSSGSSFEISVGNKAAVPQPSDAMKRIKVDETLNRSSFSMQKGPIGFEREDSRPCCCHRKEKLGQGDSYNFEETQLLKRPLMVSSFTLPKTGRQIDLGPKIKPRVVDRLPEDFSLTNCANTRSLDVSIPRINSLERPRSNDSPDARLTTSYSNSDSVSPSSNPTLRLMGKNLMVVNKEEDSSVPLVLNTPNPLACYPFPQVSAFTRTPPCSIQNQSSSSYHMSQQNAVNTVQDPEQSMKQCYSMNLAKSMNVQSGVKAPQAFPAVTTGFLNHSKDVGFKSPVESYEHMGQYYVNTRPNQLKNGSFVAPLHNVERVQTVPECHSRTAVSSPATSMKEIIFIDDLPKNAIEVNSDVAHHHADLREHHIFSHGTVNTAAASFDPKHAFNSLPGALNIVHEANINGTPSRQVAVASIKWSCIPEGMVALNQIPFIAGSSSDHSRSVTTKPLGFACRRFC